MPSSSRRESSSSPLISNSTLRSQSSHSPVPQSKQKPFLQVKDQIVTTNGPSSFQVEGVAPETGYQVARSLSEDGDVERKSPIITFNPMVGRLSVVIPTGIHDSVLTWVSFEGKKASRTGFFTSDEDLDLQYVSNRRFDDFPVPWSNIYKEPGAGILFDTALLPCVVFETAYTESWPKLQEDKRLWLEGGANHVNAILVTKWLKRANGRVAGYLEIHRRGGAVSPRVDIFPAPQPGAPPQTLTWHRRDFYPGGRVPPGRNGSDTWVWDVDVLRRFAAQAMTYDNLRPAQVHDLL